MCHETCMCAMGWLWSVGSIKFYVSCAKEPYKRDDILQKRPIILSILPTVATPLQCIREHTPERLIRSLDQASITPYSYESPV